VFGVCCVRWNLRVVMSVYVPSPLQTPQMSFVASEKGFLSHPLRQLVPLKEIKLHKHLLIRNSPTYHRRYKHHRRPWWH